MKRIVLILFILLPTRSLSQVILPDPHPTFQQQLQILLGVHQFIPWIFEEGAEYDVEFFQLLTNNDTIVNALKQDPEFMSLSEKKPRLNEIVIEQMRTQVKRRSLISEEAKKKWDALLIDPNLVHLSDINSATAYVAQQEQVLIARKETSAAKFIEGLTLMFPAKQRQKILQLPTIEEKVAALSQHNFDTNELAVKFDPTRHGLQAHPFTWQQYIQVAQQRVQNEKFMLQFWYILATHNAAGDSSLIVTWLESKRDQFASAKYSRLSDLLRGLIKELKASETSEEISVHDTFRLVEVPPILGIWRGLVGGDCATSYASAYAYMPTEYTYFIYDKANNLKGYASLTSVFTDAEMKTKAWYLHDITGSRLSPDSMVSIIYGLKKVSKELGFDSLVMPTPERIKLNNNHMSLITVQQGLIAKSDRVPLKYVDDTLRANLANFGIAHNYDSAASNKVAHVLEVDPRDLDSVKVSVRPTIPPNLLADREIGALEGTLLILDLLTSARVEVSRQELQAAVNDVQMGGLEINGINYEQRMLAAQNVANNLGLNWQYIHILNEQLSNFQQQDLDTYYKSIAEYFKILGFEFDKEWIKSRPYLFYEGHLRAPDAATHPKHWRTTEQFVMTLIKRWPNPVLAYKLVEEHKKVFEKSDKFLSFVKSFEGGSEADLAVLKKLNEIGFNIESDCEKVLHRKAK